MSLLYHKFDIPYLLIRSGHLPSTSDVIAITDNCSCLTLLEDTHDLPIYTKNSKAIDNQ